MCNWRVHKPQRFSNVVPRIRLVRVKEESSAAPVLCKMAMIVGDGNPIAAYGQLNSVA